MKTEYEWWLNSLIDQSFGKRYGTGPSLCVTFEKCKCKMFPAGLEKKQDRTCLKDWSWFIGEIFSHIYRDSYIFVTWVCLGNFFAYWECLFFLFYLYHILHMWTSDWTEPRLRRKKKERKNSLRYNLCSFIRKWSVRFTEHLAEPALALL